MAYIRDNITTQEPVMLSYEGKNQSIDFFYFISSDYVMQEGDVIESQPRGLFLKHNHGQLIVYKESGDNYSSPIMLWQTRLFEDDGSSIRSRAIFQKDCNLVIESETASKKQLREGIIWYAWTGLGILNDKTCTLGWHLPRNELIIDATDTEYGQVFPVAKSLTAVETFGENATDQDRLFLMNSVRDRLMQGFVLVSDPPGVYLQHNRGKLILLNGKPGKASSEILWETHDAYDYDGDTDLTWSWLSDDCNLAIYGGQAVLWSTASRQNSNDFPPFEKCFLSWLPSEQRLVLNGGERNFPGQEIWTSRDFIWEPVHPGLSQLEQGIVLVLTRISAALSTCGSGLIIFIIISRWIKKKRMNSTRDRLVFFMSCLDFLNSISHAVDVSAIPRGSYGIVGAIGNEATCTAQGFFIQLGFGVPLYNCMICCYALLIIRFKMSDHFIATRIEPCMHLIALGYAFVTASIGAYLQLYNSNGSFCWVDAYPIFCDNLDGVKCLRGGHAYLSQWLFAGIILILSFLLIIITTTYLFCFIRGNTRKMQKRYGRISVNNNQHIEVGKQSFLYVLAFVVTFSWPLAAAIVRHLDRGVPIWLNALQSFFFPLQGFWNVIIFLRPTFTRISRQYRERSFLWKIRATIRKVMSLKNPPPKISSSRRLYPGSSKMRYGLNNNSLSLIPSQAHNDVGSRETYLQPHLENVEDTNLAFIRYHNKCTSSNTHRGDVLDDDRIKNSVKRASLKLNQEDGGEEDGTRRLKRFSLRAVKKSNIDLRETQSLEEVYFREDAFSTSRKDLDHEKVETAYKRASYKTDTKAEESSAIFDGLDSLKSDDFELDDCSVQSSNQECMESSSTSEEESSSILFAKVSRN